MTLERVVVEPPPFLPISWFSPIPTNETRLEVEKLMPKQRVRSWGHAAVVFGGLLLVAAGMFTCLYDKRQNVSMRNNVLRSDSGPLNEVAEWDCEYIMVFPLRGSTSSNFHISGTRMMYIKWDDMVPGLSLAKQVFLDPSKAHIFSNQELEEKFKDQMTKVEYNQVVCELLADVIGGDAFGLEVSSFPSVDHDEVFLKLRMPVDNDNLAQYASMARYRMALADDAYEKVGLCVPQNVYGEPVRACTPYVPNDSGLFVPFRFVDRLRLLCARLNHHLDLNELMNQQVIAEHFPAHELDEVNSICKEWANPRHWYKLPERGLEDRIRDYFGEEVAWLFVWQSFFMYYLTVPAFVGGLLFFRRFWMPDYVQRDVQLMFAFMMAVWAAVFNCGYIRYEARVRQQWGMGKVVSPALTRDQYVPEAEGSWHVRFIQLLGDGLAIMMVLLCVVGVRWVHGLRESMLVGHSHWVWQQGAALLMSMQILGLDMMWRSISKRLVDSENHKTPAQWHRSWIQKVFLVRIFNNIYPFLYIGFIKQFSYQGCPSTTTGCLDELQRYLLTYFVTRLLVHLASDIFLVLLTRAQIVSEIGLRPAGEQQYMHLQVQAKSQDYDEVMRLDDWTENVLTFMFLACFNVVLPVIAVLALITTMLEARCLAHRNCCFLRRPVPADSQGIGEWQRVLEGVEFIAVIVNVSFAVFTMTPMKDLHPLNKAMVFIIAEHALLLMKYLLKAKFPEMPSDVEDIDQVNEDVVRRITPELQQHRRVINPIQANSRTSFVDISPKAYGGRRNSSVIASQD